MVSTNNKDKNFNFSEILGVVDSQYYYQLNGESFELNSTEVILDDGSISVG